MNYFYFSRYFSGTTWLYRVPPDETLYAEMWCPSMGSWESSAEVHPKTDSKCYAITVADAYRLYPSAFPIFHREAA